MSPWSLLRQVAPIDTLPVELISYIFVLATHASTDHQTSQITPVNLNSITAPLVLSTISKRWRNIALSTSALWTTLCITIQNVVDHSDGMDSGPSELVTTGLTAYLSLSRKYPVDILIDGRDPHWDFTEEESSIEGLRYELEGDYIHPFSRSHMTTTLGVLLPHLQRWRSLTILTDTWGPMDAALKVLRDDVDASGAPLLESLTLMRCNEYVSYADFHPVDFKDPKGLPFIRNSTAEDDKTPLPRLRSLNLQGVHVNWNTLPCLIPSSTVSDRRGGLRHLHLKYHAWDVRPSTREFHNILRASPDLRTLSVVVSGPYLETNHGQLPVSLPHLEHLHLGYTNTPDACHMLSMLNAPNLKELTLEDAAHFANPNEEDAADILRYLTIGTPSFTDNGIAGNATAAPKEDMSDDPATTFLASPSSKTGCQQQLPFPLLRNVTLTRVHTSAEAFAAFFDSQRDLEHLELTEVSDHALSGLLYQQSYTTSPDIVTTSPCPCPNLRTLCVRAAQIDAAFIIKTLPQQRALHGAHLLEKVEVYVSEGTLNDCVEGVWDDDSVDGSEEDESVDDKCGVMDQNVMVEVDHCARKWGTGTAVKMFHPPAILEPVSDFEIHYDPDSAGDPFALGGAFNDPAFDEYYANHQLWT